MDSPVEGTALRDNTGSQHEANLQANASLSVTEGEGQTDQGHMLRLYRDTKEFRFHSLSEVQTRKFIKEQAGKRGMAGVV